MEKELKIAVLIDADNVSEKYVKVVFDEVSNHGTPTYKPRRSPRRRAIPPSPC